jgi:hypothetical protein
MRKLWMILFIVVVGFNFAGLAEEQPTAHSFFKQTPKPLDRGIKAIAVSVQAVRDDSDQKGQRSPMDRIAQNEADLYPFFWGIDYYGRWVMGVIGSANYILPSPVRIILDGEEAFRIMPQSTLRTTTKPWIKSFGPISYLENYVYFERSGQYDMEIEMPGAPWKVSRRPVIVAPHGEKYQQCLIDGRVRTTLVVDWLEINPQRILHATTSNGTYLGDFWGTRAFQIPETGVWVAFYELELSLTEYQQKTASSLSPFDFINLTADKEGNKVTVWDVEWGWPPFAPCPVTASSFTNNWNEK